MQHKAIVIAATLLVGVGLIVFQMALSQVTPALAAGPELDLVSGIAWGPCYYTDDIFILPEQNRAELAYMRVVDRLALTGATV